MRCFYPTYFHPTLALDQTSKIMNTITQGFHTLLLCLFDRNPCASRHQRDFTMSSEERRKQNIDWGDGRKKKMLKKAVALWNEEVRKGNPPAFASFCEKWKINNRVLERELKNPTTNHVRGRPFKCLELLNHSYDYDHRLTGPINLGWIDSIFYQWQFENNEARRTKGTSISISSAYRTQMQSRQAAIFHRQPILFSELHVYTSSF